MRAKSGGVWEQIPKRATFGPIAQATKPLCLLLPAKAELLLARISPSIGGKDHCIYR
jgi:hypothetical protein